MLKAGRTIEIGGEQWKLVVAEKPGHPEGKWYAISGTEGRPVLVVQEGEEWVRTTPTM